MTNTNRELVKDLDGNIHDFEDCTFYADRELLEELNASTWESNQDYFVAYLAAHLEKYGEANPFQGI